MKKFDSKRKGFTLVELLIVIVVIGILSAMMMLSSSEAVSSARATTIVADMRNIKTAALALYTDKIDTYSTNTYTAPTMDDIKPYLTSGKTTDNGKLDGYEIVVTTNKDWFVKYAISGTNVDKIKTKLAGRAASTGLLASDTVPTTTNANVYTAGTGNVYMYIR